METSDMVISSDSHILEPPGLWTSRFPLRLKDKAPRVVRTAVQDEWWLDDEMILPVAGPFIQASFRNQVYGDKQFGKMEIQDWDAIACGRWEDVMPGAYDPKEFLKDNALDGVHAAVIYPGVGLIWYRRPNSEVLREIFRSYNDWIAEFCSSDPNKLRGVAMILLDDVEDSVKELERCHKMGLTGAQIPTYPEPHHRYSNEWYEPLWEAAEALKMPLSLHIQSWRPQPMFGYLNEWSKTKPWLAELVGDNTGGLAFTEPVDFLATTDFWARKGIGEMIFSGVFERHPNMHVVAVEYDTGFVPYFLGRMDWTYHEFPDITAHMGGDKTARFKNDMLPSDFWRQNVRLTFQEDPLGMRLRDLIGVETLMWGNDYPHRESTWPRSMEKIEETFRGVTQEEKRMIIGGNTAKLYNIT